MNKRKMENPPISKVPTREEILKLGADANEYIKACIREIEPAADLRSQVQLGMLTKILKMYHNLLRVADSGDSETPAILARGVYEYVLSFTYMVVNDESDPDIYEKFRMSALARSHQMLKAVKKSRHSNRTTTKDMIIFLETMLTNEGYDASKTQHALPRSWHPSISYMKMAHSLGGEFKDLYDTFYELTSIYVHPNWHDIKQQLVFERSGSAKAMLLNKPQPLHPMVTATCMALKLAEICRISFIRHGVDKDRQATLIKEIQKTHYALHNN